MTVSLLQGMVLAALLWQAAEESVLPGPPTGEQAVAVLNEVWEIGRASIYPLELAARFDEDTRAALEVRLTADPTLPLADALNPFLKSLGVSHTRFFDVRHQGYYMLRSLFATRDLDSPKLHVMGVQMDSTQPGRVRAVLDGLPAAEAGMQVGDIIVSVNGEPYGSLLQWQGGDPVMLLVESDGGAREFTVQPTPMGKHQALLQATRNSQRTYTCDEQTVSYMHLWSGTNDAFLATLKQAVAKAMKQGVSGFILDLRDGYGGAWWPYLDPFFADRNDYFVATAFGPDGESDPMRAEPQDNADHFRGDVAVLINGGTRSGKESLAWQFKRSGRARLFGTTTEGAFTAGRGIFADRDAPYMLYLSVAEYQLDGTKIEGGGVAPDVVIERPGAEDLPLRAALKHLGCGEQTI